MKFDLFYDVWVEKNILEALQKFVELLVVLDIGP